MKDQVTSIEQSKRLIQQGVPAEKASKVWHRMFRDKKAARQLQIEVLQADMGTY